MRANGVVHPETAPLAVDKRQREAVWIISHSLNDGWSVGTPEDLQLIITGEDEIINKIPCNKFFK